MNEIHEHGHTPVITDLFGNPVSSRQEHVIQEMGLSTYHLRADDSGEIQRLKPPSDSAWEMVEVGPAWTAWHHRPSEAVALVSVSIVEAEKGPEHHVSVTVRRKGKPTRPGRGVAMLVMRDFGFEAHAEDNHVRGVARHFWKPVNADLDGVCPCVATEKAEVTPIPGVGEEGDDFVFREEPAK